MDPDGIAKASEPHLSGVGERESESSRLTDPVLYQLIAVFVAAAMMGDQARKYIPIMREGLSVPEQTEIMQILKQKEEERERLASTGVEDIVVEASRGLDPGLEAEAEIATLAAEHDRLTKRLADANTRLEHLQISHEGLREELEKVQGELQVEKQKHGANESQMIQALRDKLREQDELISNQESQAEDDRQTKQRLTQEKAQLTKKADLADQLRDQVQELRHKNEELNKKANTMERYKQKLESQRGIEADLQNAMYELGDAKEKARQYQTLKDKNAQYEVSMERFRDLVRTLEQQLEDNRIKRIGLEDDIYAFQAQLNRLREQKGLDEARIADLEQQILHGAAPSLSPSVSQTGFNLEEELQHTTEPTSTAQSLEVSKLRAENSLLRNNMGVASENNQLRTNLEVVQTEKKRFEDMYNTVFEKHVVAQEQIHALIENLTNEGLVHGIEAALKHGPLSVLTTGYLRDEAYRNLRRELAETSSELQKQKGKAQDLEAQVADRNRELLSLRTDSMSRHHLAQCASSNRDAVGAMEKGSADALELLKSTDQLISGSLKNELDALRSQHHTLRLDYDHQKEQLIDALVSKEQLRKTIEEEGKEQPSAATAASPKAGEAVGADAHQAAVAELVRKHDEKIEKLLAHLNKQKEVSPRVCLLPSPALPAASSATDGESSSCVVEPQPINIWNRVLGVGQTEITSESPLAVAKVRTARRRPEFRETRPPPPKRPATLSPPSFFWSRGEKRRKS